MKTANILWLLCAALVMVACGTSGTTLRSPGGRWTVRVVESGGRAMFSVHDADGCVLRPSRLGLETDKRQLADGLRLASVSQMRLVTDNYQMLTGKRSHPVNRAAERTYSFENAQGDQLTVTFRAYDDGIVLKYGLPQAEAGERVVAEHTAYQVPAGSARWMQPYVVGYEGFYPHSTDGRLPGNPDAGEWGYPALVSPREGVFMLLTEANLGRGHCGSYLCNKDDGDRYGVRLVDRQNVRAGWESPWRVLIAGALSDVVESTLVTDVSAPSRLDDVSWIKPGAASWIYWAYNHGTKDFRLVKQYIDLAARMKWPYSLIDWEWDEMGGGGSLPDALEYAREAGVGPLVWYNSSTSWLGPGPLFRLNTKENREKEFAWLAGKGVRGVKVDFFPGDSVSVVDYYIDLLEDAARHRLAVDFHGTMIPKGWQRTYPHLLTVEAVLGAEWYNNDGRLTHEAARHNATLPFTRGIIGPMDYTPGTFSDSQHPHLTTFAHELALTVVFESGLQCMPDRPEVYDSLPAPVRQFLSHLPTAWDDTKLLAGYPGEEVVMARRKGDVWYVAGINGTECDRRLEVPLARLGLAPGQSVAWFCDSPDGRGFAQVEEETLAEAGGAFHVDCLPRGGFVAVVRPGVIKLIGGVK